MSCYGGFGSGSFGSTSFGAGPANPTLSAVQLELNSVVVTLVGVDVVVDPIELDPLDPAAWELRLSTDPSVSGAALPLVQAVVRESDDSVRVYFDAVCTPGQAYEIVYLPIEDGDCGISGSASFVGFGLPTLMSPMVGTQLLGRYDLANPSLRADAQGNVVVLGTLQVDSTGDLQNETGVAYLRKRIVRRYTTRRGSILALPLYGLAIPMKRNFSVSEMLRLQSECIAQCRQEPDVAQVSVSITQPTPGAIIIFTRIRTVNGVADEFTTSLPGA
jgi:hypothetical protein